MYNNCSNTNRSYENEKGCVKIILYCENYVWNYVKHSMFWILWTRVCIQVNTCVNFDWGSRKRRESTWVKENLCKLPHVIISEKLMPVSKKRNVHCSCEINKKLCTTFTDASKIVTKMKSSKGVKVCFNRFSV